MGPRSRHTAQEGDAFCLLELNILWCEKCKSIPEQQQRTLWRLKETGTKVSISTVKRVLYRHNLKGRSARKKPLIQNRHKKARLRFSTAHEDIDHTFWRNVWSDETKIKLFGHYDHAAGGTGALHKIDGITRIENYVDILKQHLKTSVRKLKLGGKMGLPNGQWP